MKWAVMVKGWAYTYRVLASGSSSRGLHTGSRGVKGWAKRVPGGKGLAYRVPGGQGVSQKGPRGKGVGLHGLRGSMVWPTEKMI